MIKGEIEQIKLKMNNIEVNSLVVTYHEQEAINIMGKRYFITGIDAKVDKYYSGNKERLVDVVVKVRAIKKG